MTRTRKALLALLACFSLLLPGMGALGFGVGAASAEADSAGVACSDDENLLIPIDGPFKWGVRESFRNYISGFAGGEITTAEGATYDGTTFDFPFADGTYDKGAQTGMMNYSGLVHFTGHHGVLDMKVSNPSLEILSPTTGKLWADVVSNDMGGNTKDFGRVHFADVTLTANDYAEPTLTLTGDPVKITAAGSEAFANFYPEGEIFDPLSAVMTMADPEPCPVVVTAEDPTSTDNEGTGSDTVTIPTVEGVSYMIDGAAVTGTYTVPEGVDAVTVTAEAEEGYVLDEASPTSWDFTFDITEPAPEPTDEPAPEPTDEPAPEPTDEPAPEPTDEPAPEPTDEPICSDIPGQLKVDSGALDWGIRESFRSYISGGAAQGEWIMGDPATGGAEGFSFPVDYGMIGQDGTGYIQYAGFARATGHHGILDTLFDRPKLVFDGSPTAKLFMHVRSNDMSGNPTDYGVVHFADIVIDQHIHADGAFVFGGQDVTLTADGAKAFADVYPEGEPLDALTTAIKASPANTCDPDPSEQPTEEPTEEPTTPPTVNPEPPHKPAPQEPSAPPADEPQPPADPGKQCTPDPHKMRVTGGTFSWGVRESFTTYVRGSIANGGWDTTGGASWNGSTFVFPAASGKFNDATGAGTVNFGGTVHFTGHHGVLDTTLSNPSLVINGKSAQLYLTVSSQDMSGNMTHYGRTHFANVALSSVSVSGGVMSISSSSVTLTDAGAKAFAGFYSPGEPLDQLSASVKLAPATVCDPETGELKEYGPDGKLQNTGADVAQMALAAMVFMTGGLALTAASRRRRS